LARVASHLNQARLIRRSEDALSRSGFAALAIDGKAGITWLTPAGSRWLAELMGVEEAELGTTPEALPKPLAEWSKKRIAVEGDSEQGTFTAQRDGKKFTARLVPCQDGREYLLLLQESSGDWNLDSLRSNLGLTPREAEILMWIARGKTNKDVGQILGSSPRTINKHLEHIFEKLGVATRAAAVAVALDRMRSEPEASA
jgi:DNA-binding CsgD family transcriptional regulator